MKYEEIISELEELIEYVKDDLIKIKLEEIANAVEILHEDSQYKIEMLCEDIDILEEKIRDYMRY